MGWVHGGPRCIGDRHATVCEGPVEHAPAGEKDRERARDRETDRERERDRERDRERARDRDRDRETETETERDDRCICNWPILIAGVETVCVCVIE